MVFPSTTIPLLLCRSKPVADLPCCSRCGALAHPVVVWSEEIPVHLYVIEKLVDKADLCLVVGTSWTVYPVAGYASDVKENGGKVAISNLERSPGGEEADQGRRPVLETM
ncbi:hypothetical protein FPV67DRAFT_400344 [Lyophyllum atratum]|nr:hypothetical protein FPV67DRAFT_400344 [Lyophyllum atratum]